MEQFPALCWPDWEIVELIGSGSYGRVYKIKREENQHTYYDALKVITIPKDASEILNLRSNGMDDANIAEYFREQANKIFQEIDTMIQLGGVTNIVGYKDHKMMEREDTIGCDIFIRMELLTPLSKYLQTNRPTPQLVVRMGIDICKALEICEKRNILHRDIKPGNIFVSDYGDFELGDFGIARVANDATQGTVAGTHSYMAPEIYLNRPYDASVDMYSLGLVLYQYLNHGRLPFMPPHSEKIVPGDMEKAFSVRMSGTKPIPALRDVPGILSNTICRACCFSPAQRYGSISEFKAALEKCLTALQQPQPAPVVQPIQPTPAQTPLPQKQPESVPVPAKSKKRRSKWLWVLLLLALIGGGVGYYLSENPEVMEGFQSDSSTEEKDEDEESSDRTEKEKPSSSKEVTQLVFHTDHINRENDGTRWLAEGQNVSCYVTASYKDGTSAANKVVYSSSNPSVATISSNGDVVAKQAGTTTLRAACGDMKREFTLHVYPVSNKGTISSDLRVYAISEGANVKISITNLDSSIDYYTANAYFDQTVLNSTWDGWYMEGDASCNNLRFTAKEASNKSVTVVVYLYKSDENGNYDLTTDLIDYCTFTVRQKPINVG